MIPGCPDDEFEYVVIKRRKGPPTPVKGHEQPSEGAAHPSEGPPQ